jgi:hypothetical protein
MLKPVCFLYLTCRSIIETLIVFEENRYRKYRLFMKRSVKRSQQSRRVENYWKTGNLLIFEGHSEFRNQFKSFKLITYLTKSKRRKKQAYLQKTDVTSVFSM